MEHNLRLSFVFTRPVVKLLDKIHERMIIFSQVLPNDDLHVETIT